MLVCVDIVGISKEEDGFLIRDTIEQTLLSMMPRRKKLVDIEVEICEEGDLGEAVGMLHKEDEDTFFMSLDRSIFEDPEYAITVVCHETTHIVQHLRKHLKDINVDVKKWRGKLYNIADINYFDLPWEVEARLSELVIGSKIIEKYNGTTS